MEVAIAVLGGQAGPLSIIGADRMRATWAATDARLSWAIDKRAMGFKLTASEKFIVTTACEKFINEILKPQFLPEIRPTEFNYPIDIRGKWHGSRYRFYQRYRSDGRHTMKGEFDAPFARLDFVGGGRFDVMWHRHTGEWFRLYRALPLTEALRCIEEDGHLHPL